MKNKILVVLAVFLGMPFMAGAAYNDVSLTTTEAVLNVNGVDILISGGNGANVESIVVNGDNFVATMPPGSYLKVSSADRRSFSLSGTGAARLASTCESSISTQEIDYPSGLGDSATLSVTVTVSGSSCAVGGGSGSSGGGASPGSVSISSSGGGGGGSSSSVASSPVSSPVTTPVSVPSPSSSPSVSSVFTKPLSIGSTNEDVTRLQTLLATDPSVYPEAIVSGYFGSLTKKAIQRFQVKHGVTTADGPGYGVFGPATRAKMQEVFKSATPSTQSPETSTSVSPVSSNPSTVSSLSSVSSVFTKPLSIGSTNEDVTRLQTLLATDPSVYPEAIVSGYFGSLTKKAIQRFQVKHGVTTADGPGYGVFGPATRAKMQEVFK